MMWPIGLSLCFVLAGGVLLQQGAPAPTPSQVPGDPARGLAVIQGKGGCLSCHRIADVGSRVGVDLSEVGAQRTPEELRTVLLSPPAEVPQKSQLYRVVTRDGKSLTGKLLNQDEFSVQMIGSDDSLHGFLKSNLREFGFTKTPPMPSYRDKLTAEEQTDVVAFLASLKPLPQK